MVKRRCLTSGSLWRTRPQLLRTQISESMRCWLFDPGSLTTRLVAACAGRFQVRVIAQHWQPPQLCEAQRLEVHTRELALIRQVYLYCDETPWVYARTVIPRSSLSGRQKHLAHLGSKSLGAVLFADPNMQRDELEIVRLQAGQELFNIAVAPLTSVPEEIWGRRSVFYLQNKPLLVNEIFLPTIAVCKKF